MKQFEPWDNDSREFDTAHGTDTAGKILPADLKTTSPNINQASSYLGVGPARMRRMVEATGISPSEFTFIDLGTGKGRPLLVAAQMGFPRIIGVEFAGDLAGIARDNARIMGFTNITVWHGDAAEYAFPAGNLLVLMHNPFWIPVMRKVMANLGRAHYERLFIIYMTPKIPEIIDEAPFVERLAEPHDPPHGTIIYRGKRH